MAGNGALDLSIRIMGKVDPSLVTAIKQTKGLTGDLANALTGTKSLGSTVANTLGVIGKTGLGIMATLTTASAVMIKKTTSMAEEYQAQAADAVKYVGGIMNDDGSIDPEKRATMEDAILKMTTQVPIKRDEMAQIAASLGQSGKSYEQIIYIVEPHERSPAYIAAAPCGMATSCTVKVPGRIKPREIGAKAYVAGAVGRSKMQVAVALPGAVEAKAVKARAFTAGTVERSHTAINIVIGGQTT